MWQEVLYKGDLKGIYGVGWYFEFASEEFKWLDSIKTTWNWYYAH